MNLIVSSQLLKLKFDEKLASQIPKDFFFQNFQKFFEDFWKIRKNLMRLEGRVRVFHQISTSKGGRGQSNSVNLRNITSFSKKNFLRLCKISWDLITWINQENKTLFGNLKTKSQSLKRYSLVLLKRIFWDFQKCLAKI